MPHYHTYTHTHHKNLEFEVYVRWSAIRTKAITLFRLFRKLNEEKKTGKTKAAVEGIPFIAVAYRQMDGLNVLKLRKKRSGLFENVLNGKHFF